MGGSKSQITGYRYALGVHMALCHGPVDAIREIHVGDKLAWSATTGGYATAGDGGEPFAPDQLGTVAGMAASAGAAAGDPALVTFAGRLDGVQIGGRYRLATAGRDPTVTIRSIAFDPMADQTTWAVDPADTAFAPQSIAVETAPEGRNPTGATGGRIRIDKPGLFGGKKREGGIVGDIDVALGGPDQQPNDYLAAQAGRAVPAYRGITALVLRQVYLGNNPYLKPWAVTLTRVLKAAGGTEQWYPATAQIVPEAAIGNAAIHIAMDASGSMSGTRMAAQIAAVRQLVSELAANADSDAPNDLRLVTWSDEIDDAIEQRNADADAYDAIIAWLDALPTNVSGGTHFDRGVNTAPDFFAGAYDKRRIVLFITDGAPSAGTLEPARQTLAGLGEIDVFAFNIALADTSATEQLDTTPIDGVPVVSPGNAGALVASLRLAFGQGPDMNPAHILRECLTNPDWGLGAQEADIGASFATAADTLFTEGFGLSLIWQRDSSIEAFMSDVLDHVDATLYVDHRTGLWELRLIRADYDPAAIPLFDETSVVDWGTLKRPEPGDLINSVTLRYTDAGSNSTGAVTVTDTALVQQMGEVIATTVEYPGIRHQGLAVRVAERDLRSLSTPVLSGEIVLQRRADSLRPGDVIALDSLHRGLDHLPMRVSEIDRGDGRDNGIRVKITEDVFALGGTALVGGRMSGAAAIASRPRPMARRYVAEASYWQLVKDLGHTEADARLAEDPDAAALVAAGNRPAPDTLGAELFVDPGTGFAAEDAATLAPSALLAQDLGDDPTMRSVAVTGWNDIADVTIGTLAALGTELVRIDGVANDTLTLGRGCLDTVPLAHPAGTPVVILAQATIASVSEVSAGDTLAAKLLTTTGEGALPLGSAPTDSLHLAGRAIRPLPVGNARANGGFTIDRAALLAGDVTLSWAHRDRLSQTSAVLDDYLAGDIGPEPGVRYAVEVAWVDPATDAPMTPPAARIDAGTGTSLVLTLPDIPAGAA
ncbi:MAG: VWA domain-containing protein, partial [Nioella sp.]